VHLSPDPPDPSLGRTVGGYRLLTKIGEGGMGVVHLAQGSDGRRVALKVLRPHVVGDDEARERLAREVSSLRRVRSPRIAEVLDADPWGETPFVATRYVPGPSLHQHAGQEGPLAGDDLRWFAAGLAEAVIAVHGVGVLHRDIKPSNVLLEGRSPVLIDFGLARLAEDTGLTRTGWLLGTPGYLAPEILFGDPATTASDVHSWAATVAFAATGRPPFGGGHPMAVMDRVRRGEHDLSGAPRELLPLLEACLAPDALDRPETAAVLADLRGPGSPTVTPDPFTVPLALVRPPAGSGPDEPATEMLGSDDPTELVEPGEQEATTTRIPHEPPPVAGAGTWVAPEPWTEHDAYPRPAYSEAPEAGPAYGDDPYAAEPPYQAWTPLPDGAARIRRGALLAALAASVAVGFALAPYLAVLALAALTLLVRAYSWTTESARDRQWRRGRRRWYDAPLMVASSPWYLLVATAGTLVLVVWSVALAVLVGVAYSLFGQPWRPGLVLMGVVLAGSLWWGPGSRRLRGPTRRVIVRTTLRPATAWVTVGVIAAGVALAAYLLLADGVTWTPQPGPPWRRGTLLGDVLAWL
jgi:hypothetical protein